MKGKKEKLKKGFVILYAVTLASIMLTIALGVASVAFKEVKFTTSTKDTNNAFFAADTGAEYVLFKDKPPSIYTPSPGIWNTTVSNLGYTGAGCAKVTITKEAGSFSSFKTTVVSKGYNAGDCSSNSINPDRIERELKITY